MTVAIKLARIGKKGQPNYRIIVIDKRKKTNSRYIEKLGFYNPLSNPVKLDINIERLNFWLGRGAQMAEGAAKLLKKQLKKDSA